MKIIALLLVTLVCLSSIVLANPDSEILGYAKGIIATSDFPNAVVLIQGSQISVGIMVDPTDYGAGTPMAGVLAGPDALKLCLLADRIAYNYPDRFNQSAGLVMDKGISTLPLAGCVINYRKNLLVTSPRPKERGF